jgi:hypothetical protein
MSRRERTTQKILFNKVAFFSRQKITIQNTVTHQQKTTTSPQKTSTKKRVFAKPPAKTRLEPLKKNP